MAVDAEQTATEYTLVLPPKQTNGDLTDEELAGVAGGNGMQTLGACF